VDGAAFSFSLPNTKKPKMTLDLAVGDKVRVYFYPPSTTSSFVGQSESGVGSPQPLIRFGQGEPAPALV